MSSALLLPTSRRGWSAITAVALLLAGAAVLEGAVGGPGTQLTGWVFLGAAITALSCLLAYPTPLIALVVCLSQGVVYVAVPGMPRGGGSQLIALMCKTDPAATPRHRGVSILLVEHGPGLTVSKDLPKLGYKGVESCELIFEDCAVPLTATLIM